MIIELFAIAGVAGLEPFTVTGTTAIISLLDFATRIPGITGGVGGISQILVGMGGRLFGTITVHLDPRGREGKSTEAIKLCTI